MSDNEGLKDSESNPSSSKSREELEEQRKLRDPRMKKIMFNQVGRGISSEVAKKSAETHERKMTGVNVSFYKSDNQ
jgi:hypothetical protein